MTKNFYRTREKLTTVTNNVLIEVGKYNYSTAIGSIYKPFDSKNHLPYNLHCTQDIVTGNIVRASEKALNILLHLTEIDRIWTTFHTVNPLNKRSHNPTEQTFKSNDNRTAEFVVK